jgi:hypothetical protein
MRYPRFTPLKTLLPAVISLTLLLFLQVALAHATLVFGTLNTVPNPPEAESGFLLQLQMMDPVRTPIENAVVYAEFGPPDAMAEHADLDAGTHALLHEGGTDAAADFERFTFAETGPGGNYEVFVQLPADGEYLLMMRDQTYPKEDAVALVEFRAGGSQPLEEKLFVFPPTDIGTATLSTWLIWLIALPLVAAGVVTVLVLAGGKKEPGSTARA